MDKLIISPVTKSQALSAVQEIKNKILLLQKYENEDILNSVSINALIEKLKKNELRLKEEKVKEVHPYEIYPHPKKNSKGELVNRLETNIVIDGKRHPITCTTYEGLIEKLFTHYYGDTYIVSSAIEAIFNESLDECVATCNIKNATIRRYKADYSRYIDEEFSKKDIRSITELDLKKYIQTLVNKQHPKEKAFLNFKRILNLIFNYAYRHKIIKENPLLMITNKRKKPLILVD